MSDLVVTVPKNFWKLWVAEGDAADEPYTGEEWAYQVSGRPSIEPGERLYVVSWGRLRGYAPVVRVMKTVTGYGICRRGDAVAVTIDEPIPGFRGYRKRWWDQGLEKPFPGWREL
jgi:hypothetical protein